jgi:hypothetical protein
MRVPNKLKRHLVNYFRFFGVYFVAATFVELWQRNVGFEHYGLIECVAITVVVLVTGWFGWRAYTGMERDGDFFVDD